MADEILTPSNVARSWHWFRQVTAPCNAACGSGIMTVNSSSGSTLQCQCDTWLWDDMTWNSRKRPPYWNSTSDFDFDHIMGVDMSFCTSLRNFIQIGPPSAEKMTSRRFSRWRMAPFDRPHTRSNSPSIVTMALSCIVLLVENRKIFIPHQYLAPRREWEFGEHVWCCSGKTRMVGLPYGEIIMTVC